MEIYWNWIYVICELLGINFKCLDNRSIDGGCMVYGYFLEMLNMELIFVREINFNYLNKLIKILTNKGNF